MIDYDKGTWCLAFAFRISGSVFPKAAAWALPNSCAAMAIAFFYIYGLQKETISVNPSSVSMLWAVFNFILGFFLVFRTQQAYTRFWEGATQLRQIRGDIFNAASSIVAFCTRGTELKDEVDKFQHLYIRLISMLHGSFLQSLSEVEDEAYEVLDPTGICPRSLEYLKSRRDSNQKCEIVMQWIHRLIIDNWKNGVLVVPGPLITKVFQDLSGVVRSANSARNLSDIPFPFTYAQMLTALLLFHWMITPVLAGLFLQSPVLAFLFTFGTTFALWGTNYIASEIENPYGHDANDLPLGLMQQDLNQSLWLLLDQRTQETPAFSFERDRHRKWKVGTNTRSFFSLTSLSLPTQESSTPSLVRKKSFFVNVRESLCSIEDLRDTVRSTDPVRIAAYSLNPSSYPMEEDSSESELPPYAIETCSNTDEIPDGKHESNLPQDEISDFSITAEDRNVKNESYLLQHEIKQHLRQVDDALNSNSCRIVDVAGTYCAI